MKVLYGSMLQIPGSAKDSCRVSGGAAAHCCASAAVHGLPTGIMSQGRQVLWGAEPGFGALVSSLVGGGV